jgi:hypothetical protein
MFNCNWVFHPVAVVQYTFTHKQYIEQYNRHKQYIEQNNSLIRKSADRARSLRGTYPGICLTTENKARKNLSQGRWAMPVCKEYTEQNILRTEQALMI